MLIKCKTKASTFLFVFENNLSMCWGFLWNVVHHSKMDGTGIKPCENQMENVFSLFECFASWIGSDGSPSIH